MRFQFSKFDMMVENMVIIRVKSSKVNLPSLLIVIKQITKTKKHKRERMFLSLIKEKKKKKKTTSLSNGKNALEI